MKNLYLIAAAIFTLALTSCKQDEEIVKYDIYGNWHPIKRVITEVDAAGATSTTSSDYTPCQQTSTWTFETDNTGTIIAKEQVGVNCEEVGTQNFTYNYDRTSRSITINYQNMLLRYGKADFTSENKMNLRIETNQNGVYHSETISFVK